MKMFLLLLLWLGSGREVLNHVDGQTNTIQIIDSEIRHHKVRLGQNQVIDSYENHGTSLYYHLDYFGKDYKDHPCYPISSSMEYQQHYSLDVIRESKFQEGKFVGSFDRISNMVHVNKGVLVITDQGKVTLVRLDTYQIVQALTLADFGIKIQLRDAKVGFFRSSNTVYIISDDTVIWFKVYKFYISLYQQVSIELTNLDFNHFSVAQTAKLSQIRSKNVRSFQITDNYVYIALGLEGLYIFEVSNKGSLKMIIHQQGAINDVKVRKVGLKVDNVIILDEFLGITFNYLQDGVIGKLTIPGIPVKNGIAMDVLRSTLVILTKYYDSYGGVDYHVTNTSWIQLNQWNFQGEIYDVDITEQFAIFLGTNGHYVMYHSIYGGFIPQNGIRHDSSSLKIHGLQELDFYEDNDKQKQIFFGITQTKLVVYKWITIPAQLNCFSENLAHLRNDVLTIKSLLNSTQCPEKVNKEDDLTKCSENRIYQIQFIRAMEFGKHKYMLIAVVLLILLVGFGIVAIIFKNYFDYQVRKSSLQDRIGNLGKDGYKEREIPSVLSSGKGYQYQVANDASQAKTPANESILG